MARFFQAKKKTQINTKHQSVTVEKLDHHGAGLAYMDNKPLFIEGALPGEEVVTQLTESKSKYARGRLIKVITPSESRITPFCPHFEQCGGCNMQHVSVEEQRTYKQQALSELMTKFAKQQITLDPVIAGLDRGYRRRARLSVWFDKKSAQLQIGFRQKASKQIVNIKACPVLAPELNQLLPELHHCLNQFSEPSVIGHVELVKADNTRVLVVRHTRGLKNQDAKRLKRFAQQYELSLYLMAQADHLELIQGPAPIYQETGVVIPFEPTHFIQVNQSVNQSMVSRALEWLELSKQDSVLDLFCGLGNFSLPIAQQVERVVGVEGVEEMVFKARSNAEQNQLTNAEFYHANLEAPLADEPWAKLQFNKVLLDPARAGATGVVEQLATLGASRVVYVSCNPATLARDSQSLLNQGFRLQRLCMLDMFPHTSHLESMALFVK
ncbi:23S rRNA (uracil(1939)-C(5))-methyltransferase RlmD [Vibrio sp. AK197]